MWAVVEFVNEPDSVALIPTNWILSSTSHCRWPPGPVVTSLIKKRTPPLPHWAELPIKILRSGIDSYETGRKYEKKAITSLNVDTTDFDTPTQKYPRRPPVRKLNPTPGKPSHSLGLATISPVEPQPSSSRSVQQRKRNVEQAFEPEFPFEKEPEKPSDGSSVNLSDYSLLSSLADIQDQAKEIEQEVTNRPNHSGYADESRHSLTQAIQQLKDRQESLERTTVAAFTEIKADLKELLCRCAGTTAKKQDELQKSIPISLPVSSKEDLQELEQWINDSANQNTLVQYFSTFGGNGLTKIVRAILRRTLTNQVALGVNRAGLNGKVGFKSLSNLRRVIIESTRSNEGQENTSESKIEAVIKVYFQNSRDLDGGASARRANYKGKQNGVVPNEAEEN